MHKAMQQIWQETWMENPDVLQKAKASTWIWGLSCRRTYVFSSAEVELTVDEAMLSFDCTARGRVYNLSEMPTHPPPLKTRRCSEKGRLIFPTQFELAHKLKATSFLFILSSSVFTFLVIVLTELNTTKTKLCLEKQNKCSAHNPSPTETTMQC